MTFFWISKKKYWELPPAAGTTGKNSLSPFQSYQPPADPPGTFFFRAKNIFPTHGLERCLGSTYSKHGGREATFQKWKNYFSRKKWNSIRVAPHFDGLDDPFQMSYPQHRNSSYFFQKSQKYFSNFGLERCLMFGTLPRGKRKFLLTLKKKVGRVL